MKIGFAFCGSFCNHPELLKLYEDIAREHEICLLYTSPSPRDTR